MEAWQRHRAPSLADRPDDDDILCRKGGGPLRLRYEDLLLTPSCVLRNPLSFRRESRESPVPFRKPRSRCTVGETRCCVSQNG